MGIEHLRYSISFVIAICFFYGQGFAQHSVDSLYKADTFFLAKKKGVIGKFGQIISVEDKGPYNPSSIIKTVNPFLKDSGKTIKNIKVLGLDFNRDINDTTVRNSNFGIRVARALHKNTRDWIIFNALFFKKGSKVYPYEIADNERYLRDLPYLQDARIILNPSADDSAAVDVLVLTKDVFSIGGTVNASGTDNFNLELKEENLAGKAQRLSLTTLYDKSRNPSSGYGIEFIQRNIKHSFIDWTLGATNFATAFNNGRKQLFTLYAHFEKPLITPYIPWIGSLDIAVNGTANNYNDPDYSSDYKYRTLNIDWWFGYNFGSKKLKYKNKQSRLRKFIALREFNQFFMKVPAKYTTIYNSQYANITGFLGAVNIFKQTLYTTNYIYGFGRNEDVPEGFNTSVIAGWYEKNGFKRAYYGLDFQFSHLGQKKGLYSTYTARLGGNKYKGNFEDADILLNVDHFTRLSRLGKKWLNRNFFSLGYTKQISPRLNAPLYLQSRFGLPYYPGKLDTVVMRATIKAETVFFNTKKYWGFRFAPFTFVDMSLATPVSQSTDKSELFPALGGGIRTRNENLIFGTLELRGYYFPKTIPGEKGWRIEFSTNLRFKYNSDFIHRPDFVSPN